MRFCHRLLLVFLFVSLTNVTFAQRGLSKAAYRFFNEGNYVEALNIFNKINNIERDAGALYKRGQANFYTNNIDAAVVDFAAAYKLGITENELYLFLAKSLHYKSEYKDAIKYYKAYLRSREISIIDQQKAINNIKQCAYALNMQYEEQIAFVESLGNTINSIYDEVHPVQSRINANKYYFSANRDDATGGLRNASGYKDEIFGKYRMDMYAVELKDGNWTSVNAFHPILNGPKNDVLLDFNPSGSIMYYFRSLDMHTGGIYTDTFDVNRSENVFPKKLIAPPIPQKGDKDLRVFSDSIIIFSSTRSGGYGGYDLYISQRKNGEWQPAQNMGSDINSPYDDISPYITKGGNKIYFSSNRLNSFGGFDIFSSTFNNEINTWSTPKNLGLPVNSPKNDVDYSVSSDGTTGVFSSDRIDSKGGYDIYFAYLKEQDTDQLMYTESLPFINDKGILVETNDSLLTIEKAKNFTKKREYYNAPFYYDKEENIETTENLERARTLADLMIIYPKLELLLSCHAVGEGYNHFDLYFSIKRAEKIAELIAKKGINLSRIHLRGAGANFPLIEPVSNGNPSRLAGKYNRRIDVSFFGVPNEYLTLLEDTNFPNENYQDEKGKMYRERMNGLAYQVEVTRVKQIYKGDVLKKYQEAIIEKRADKDEYIYTIGLFDNYQEAKNLRDILSRQNIERATVIPYVKGLRVNLSDIEGLKNQYPDLSKYLLYEQN